MLLDGKHYRAPRLLLMSKLGRDLRPGCRVQHTCENTRCCNPAHIIEYCPEEALAERLWQGVLKAGPEECWWWWGEPYDEDRYGRMTFRDKNYATHRIAWEVTNGPIPAGLLVLHTCDNRKCCNPAHLFLGTHKDNEADKHGKGRGAVGRQHGAYTKPESRRRGTLNGKARLTDFQVYAIRDEYALGGISMKTLAEEYRVSEPTIRQIVTGKTWTHVPGPIAPVETPKGPIEAEERAEIRRKYAAGEATLTGLMEEHRVGFQSLKLILFGVEPPPRSRVPPPARSGEAHPMAKVTWEQVREMRRLAAEGVKQEEIADRFGLKLAATNNILCYRTWIENKAGEVA